uniref:Uncharacterized protein n=1 Tax=Anguilla anguilla TaxID=7936 RepID=A0A0E9VNM6_ANGAN
MTVMGPQGGPSSLASGPG